MEIGLRKVIYLIDDDEEHIERWNRSLSGLGYKVDFGYSVEAALAYLTNNTPDCIISDGYLGLSRHGIEILRFIRDNDRLRNTSFIMVTGMSSVVLEDAVRSLDGILLEKPVRIKDIVEAIEQQISLHQQRLS